MSIDSISKAYSKINFTKPRKQAVITRESLGISIRGPEKNERVKSPTERISNGLQARKDAKFEKELQKRAKASNDAIAKKNIEDHEKAMAHLNANTKGSK
ncbi:hypothetical protein PH235_10555 [Trichococcus sp. K1Tr]|uniref:hypothetical protein n=1 Tax=Trichococcus sp. K1Tr TaxID=3020847 RepID=UPI00232D981C|nr:hypothetical protein [Trichococcus sp. K1Tr]MDB6353999.1 hypothetical protein [Trichococcus sp. K1Tr]